MSSPIPDIIVGNEVEIDLAFTLPDGVTPIDISGHILFVTVKMDLSVPDAQAPLQLRQVAPNSALSQSGKIALFLTNPLTAAVAAASGYTLDITKVIPGSPAHPWTFVYQTINFLQPATQSTS